jgi:hypothetical protein
MIQLVYIPFGADVGVDCYVSDSLWVSFCVYTDNLLTSYTSIGAI